MADVTLVLGGARSGKSAYAQHAAEARAARRGGRLVFIATAEGLDEEMTERIARHRSERDGRWRTVEAPLDLPAALRELQPDEVTVVDCLTLWLSNAMLSDSLAVRRAALLTALSSCRAPLWLVSNEVGLGLVPETALGRRFRDEAGRLNQAIAAIADVAVLLVAGLPLALKGRPN